ncbi:cysteine-rich CWC family protein [Marinomonas foliarum]|uniref:cysteine-rich CWC family protein n=1 Tax=Marinomonas foliarum TaxID=491950 RepID=UPI000DF3229B
MKCPFCLKNNGCVLDENQNCWCFSVRVPKDLLAYIPLEQKGSVCVCQECIEFYRTDKLGFLKVFDFESR